MWPGWVPSEAGTKMEIRGQVLGTFLKIRKREMADLEAQGADIRDRAPVDSVCGTSR